MGCMLQNCLGPMFRKKITIYQLGVVVSLHLVFEGPLSENFPFHIQPTQYKTTLDAAIFLLFLRRMYIYIQI